ncbi:MAG: YihA family ribosome biogenesis GTP-binding protein [Chitinophagaceae bacterium]|nr:YihA family ribosome biogenesis GTP-binding protein [Chitinophagaceae bacterium]MBN8668570.1 YihA family ribosome biogenesis GTP-binding protein [Chitinophagales bacterium]
MQIHSATYLISSAYWDKCPKPDRPEYAFIGRSNVGKSSLINMLCDNQKLAKTSASPGKTQLINHFEILSKKGERSKAQKWYLVDLPGYGYAKVAQKDRRRWEQMIENYLRKRENLVNVFTLIDSRHTPQAIDLEFIEQLGKWGIPFSIVFTKTDKNKPMATQRNINAFLDKMKENWESLPPWFTTSALTKLGREEILDYINDLNNSDNIHTP